MYADHTSFTLSAYDPVTVEEKLNKDLDEVQKWLKSNKLSLNVKKTKYMIIGSHHRLRHLNGDFCVINYRIDFLNIKIYFSIYVVSEKIFFYVNGSLEEHF